MRKVFAIDRELQLEPGTLHKLEIESTNESVLYRVVYCVLYRMASNRGILIHIELKFPICIKCVMYCDIIRFGVHDIVFMVLHCTVLYMM